MKSLKKFFAIAALCLGLTGQQAHAQIPVTDGVHILQSVIGQVMEGLNWVQQVADMKMQYEQLTSQLKQAEQMYSSMNGIRGMASLINNPLAREYLPSDAASLLSQGKGLSADVAAIKKAAALMDVGKLANATGRAAESMKRSQDQLGGMQASAERAYSEAGKRFATLQQLIDKVDGATDAKAIADLQARIGAEQVMMQNETAKLTMMKQVQDAQLAIERQKGREAIAKLGSGNAVSVTGF